MATALSFFLGLWGDEVSQSHILPASWHQLVVQSGILLCYCIPWSLDCQQGHRQHLDQRPNLLRAFIYDSGISCCRAGSSTVCACRLSERVNASCTTTLQNIADSSLQQTDPTLRYVRHVHTRARFGQSSSSPYTVHTREETFLQAAL